MPITPLHFGVMAPVNKLKPGAVSNVSVVMVNCLIDLPTIWIVLTDQSIGLHEPFTHSFWGALAVIALVSICRFKCSKWVLGAWLGGLSHILLDMLVHADMSPFYPYTGNPVYMGWMQPLSLILLPLLAWWALQMLDSIRKGKHSEI
jgi:membrane-bound metal-dependent hydrolase YbcI (DUF457 family)